MRFSFHSSTSLFFFLFISLTYHIRSFRFSNENIARNKGSFLDTSSPPSGSSVHEEEYGNGVSAKSIEKVSKSPSRVSITFRLPSHGHSSSLAFCPGRGALLTRSNLIKSGHDLFPNFCRDGANLRSV